MPPKCKPNRHVMLCPVCLKTQDVLQVHLRRVCMKAETPEAIAAVVAKAKREVIELLSTGRVIPYMCLWHIFEDDDPMNRLIEELQRRHIVVTGVPPPLPRAIVKAASKQPPESVATEAKESDEERASVSSGEYFQCKPDVQWKKVTSRQLMAEKGLYGKHPLDHPLLKSFATYLEKDLHNENYRQEVDNVSRYLYYVDPQAPSLKFVRNREKITQYLRELSQAGLKKQTQMNYLKSLKRFLGYHTVRTNLRHDDQPLFEEAKHFIEYIGSLQTSCAKQVSKEITQKSMLMEQSQPTPHECLAVLSAAKKDFMGVLGKAFPDRGATLEMTECHLVVHYLEAVLILRHLQRPGVVEHMTVQEWVLRTRDTSGNVVIGVKEHKTAAQQVATFSLSEVEEHWFHVYYTQVRPKLLKCSKKRKRSRSDEEDGEDRFFISTTGRPICNASSDLNRLHVKYNVKPVTSQVARRVFETATKTMTDGEKSPVADYLTHSAATAEKHYRMKQPEAIVKASQLLARIAGDSSSVDSGDEGPSHGTRGTARPAAPKPASTSYAQMDAQAAFDQLLRTHPVTLNGVVPDKEARRKVSPDFHRQLYERWLKAQMKVRVQHILAYFSRRLPTENRVNAWITKEGWTTNRPTAATIIQGWKPSGGLDTVGNSRPIQKMITSQKWRGLLVTDIPGKGKGVVATRKFQAGEVICDYHGRVITAKESQEIHQTTSEKETGYMFFFTNSRGQAMCIDAHSEVCECHPERQTVGRLINHSKAKYNLKPRHYVVEDKDVILFLASRDIEVDEELLFHYGVGQKSFRGEGLDLSWLS